MILVSVPIMYEIRKHSLCHHTKSFLFSAGVQGVQVEELWSLDPEQFENLKYIHLIFYFKKLKHKYIITVSVCALT